jgi:hypothetical protein
MGVPSIGVGLAEQGALDPTVPIPGDVGHMFAAGLLVNQIDDECPHDRTPLFDQSR